MIVIKRLGLIVCALVLAAPAAAQQLPGGVGHPEREMVDPDPAMAPAGEYVVDQGHAAVIGRILHGNLAYLYFRINPTGINGGFDYDPENPEATRIEITMDADAIDFGLPRFDARIKSDEFVDAERYPVISFVSTDIARTDRNHGTITGDLTMKGVTAPFTMDATFNGSGPAGRAIQMGFSATAELTLSDFNINIGENNVSGPVLLNIDIEFENTETETDINSVLQFLQGR
jgi:polyisoprenoid-binding protein YceI